MNNMQYVIQNKIHITIIMNNIGIYIYKQKYYLQALINIYMVYMLNKIHK